MSPPGSEAGSSSSATQNEDLAKLKNEMQELRDLPKRSLLGQEGSSGEDVSCGGSSAPVRAPGGSRAEYVEGHGGGVLDRAAAADLQPATAVQRRSTGILGLNLPERSAGTQGLGLAEISRYTRPGSLGEVSGYTWPGLLTPASGRYR